MTTHDTAEHPLVSVIMPVRNEGAYIERSLGSVLGQSYGLENMEILIVDGQSDDDTRARAMALANQYPKAVLQVLDNPRRTAPYALNIGLAKARGSIVVRVDGHCEVGPDYVAQGVRHLLGVGVEPVDAVGGPLDTIGETSTAQAIAVAMSSRFGVGGSAFRTVGSGAPDRLVDTVAFPAYRREIFQRLGGFDVELVRNQDDELNYRLRKAGGLVRLTADMPARYYSRGTFSKLWSQYRQYGFWKVRVLQKHPRQMSPRQFIPGLFVLSILVVAALAPWWGWWLVALPLGAYGLALITATAMSIQRSGAGSWWRLPIAFTLLHVGYGFGFLVGLIRFAGRWGRST